MNLIIFLFQTTTSKFTSVDDSLQDANSNTHEPVAPLLMKVHSSGVAREGVSGGTRPGAQALRARQHTFCSHFKRVFKLKFGPKDV